MVDDFTNLSFSGYYDSKNGMVEATCEQFNLLKKAWKPVKCRRYDNGGGNLKFQKRIKSKDWKLNTKFQFTERETPQQNSKVEKKFDTITSRGDSMMSAANLKNKRNMFVMQRSLRV